MPQKSALNLSRYTDVLVAVAVVLVVAMLVIPVPKVMLDILLVVNLTISLMILLVAVYNQEALQFSVFPSLLLISTLFRLSLNVSSARLILRDADAGNVIHSFGSFVIGDNAVVGFIVFIILVVIQFVVITRGAERVSEVAARFTLDAMPGKQMAIDADLNAGLINDQGARERRRAIEQEADFYGAMDGASKFVKGDAIAAIVIVVVNLVGGFIVGMVQGRLGSWSNVLSTYSMLTVGDGLVSQIPALLISTATGIIVTRAASEGNLSQDLAGQLFRQPRVMFIAGAFIFAMGLVPGLPGMPFWTLGAITLVGGFFTARAARSKAEVGGASTQAAAVQAEETRKPENVLSLLQLDPLEVELGYGLLSLADQSQGGDLMDRVVMLRRQVALDLGLVLPYIRIRDNMGLKPNQYVVKLKGIEVARGELLPDHFLAMDPGTVVDPVPGIDTREPAFGLPALWVAAPLREQAEFAGYTVVDSPAVVATHLTELIRSHAHELLGRQEVKALVDLVKETHSAVVEELTPKALSLGEIQKVLQNLLREGISIRDLVTIFETLADYAGQTRDLEILTEFTRAALARSIMRQLGIDGRVRVITMHPDLEARVAKSVEKQAGGTYLNLDPEILHRMVQQIGRLAGDLAALGQSPVMITGPAVRPYVKRITERSLPKLVVLSYNEVDGATDVESVGMVTA